MTDAYQPARLPASEDDLAAWTVYADYLMTLGEGRGEAMALELALPAAVPRADLVRWQAIAAPDMRLGGPLTVGWSLGHARELALPRGPHGEPVAAEMLARAREFVTSPVGRLVEHVSFDHVPGEHAAHWRAFCGALPPTCTRVSIGLPDAAWPGELEDLIALLPPHVTELGVLRLLGRDGELTLRTISDRFTRVDLSRALLDRYQLGAVRIAIADTTQVRVAVANLDFVLVDVPRCTLGMTGDAALVTVATRTAIALPRCTLVEQQARHGLIPLRTQWGRLLSEEYSLVHTPGRLQARPGEGFIRRAGGRWTLTGLVDLIRIAGKPLAAGETAELVDGAWVSIGDLETLFFSADVDAQTRARITQRTF